MAAKYQADSTMEPGKSDGCVVCCSPSSIFAFGACDHSVCYECSTRMRVLCEQNECPICRQELAQVLFARSVERFADVQWKNWLVDRVYNIYFENGAIKRAYEKLLEHVCNLCSDDDRSVVFRSLQQLKEHTRREHDRYFCDLCVNNLKIFSSEYKAYTRPELAQHRRKGEENTSHRGHPLCEYCEERYLDSDELFRHLRRDHFFCHFCDADGVQEFFCDYLELRQHFLEIHYLCEEGSCRDEKFTSAFRTDIDLKAHKATVHNKHMTKAQVKLTRTLELEFPLPPRPQQSSRGVPTHDGLNFITRSNRGRKVEIEEYPTPDSASGGSNGDAVTSTTSVPSIDSRQDFPSLNAATPQSHQLNFHPKSFAQTTSRASKFAVGEESSSQFAEEFPSLGKQPSQAASLQGPWNASQGRAMKSSTASAPPKKKQSIYMQLTNQDFPSLPSGPSYIPSYTVASSSNTVQNASSASVKKDASKKPTRISPPSSALTSTTSASRSRCIPFCDDDFPQLAKDKRSNDEPELWVHFNKNSKSKATSTASSGKAAGRKRDGNEKKSSSVYISVQDNQLSLQDVADSLLGGTSVSVQAEQKGAKNARKANAEPLSTSYPKVVKASTEQNGQTKKHLQNGEHKANTPVHHEKEKPTKNNVQKDKNSNLSTTKTLDMDDFPELPRKVNSLKIRSVNNSQTSNVPPPGFNNVGNSSKPPPPGFSTSKSDKVSRKHEDAFTTGFSYRQYHEPENFKGRNQALVNQAQDIAGGDPLHFGAFKTLSGRFRQGILSAADYYEQCLNLLGDRFLDIFPELLVLLPDIAKQKELLGVHNDTQHDINDNTKGAQFLVCATCQQVLTSADFRKHMAVHDQDQTFRSASSIASLAK